MVDLKVGTVVEAWSSRNYVGSIREVKGDLGEPDGAAGEAQRTFECAEGATGKAFPANARIDRALR